MSRSPLASPPPPSSPSPPVYTSLPDRRRSSQLLGEAMSSSSSSSSSAIDIIAAPHPAALYASTLSHASHPRRSPHSIIDVHVDNDAAAARSQDYVGAWPPQYSPPAAHATAEKDDAHRRSSALSTITPSSPPTAAVATSPYITAQDMARLGNLPYLNGMRALATVMIELVHVVPEGTKYVYFFGYMALTVHFMQGAFLITSSLLTLQDRQQKATTATRAKANTPAERAQLAARGPARLALASVADTYGHLPQFFMARWVRLYPALVLLLGLNAVWWMNRHDDLTHMAKLIVRALFKFTQSDKLLYVSDSDPYPNPFANLWFLDVQEHFYLFWALALPLITRFRAVVRIGILMVLFVLSYRIRAKEDLYNATLPINMYKMVVGAAIQMVPLPRRFVVRHAQRIATLFCLGALVWGFTPRFSDNFTEREHRLYGDNMGIVAVLLVTLASVAKALKKADGVKVVDDVADDEDARPSWPMARIHAWLGPEWCVLDLLDCQLLNFIGRISYSWYLWQVPLMHYEHKFRCGYDGVGPTAEAFAISLFSTFYVEEPIRNAYTAWRKRQRAQAAAVAAAAQSSPLMVSAGISHSVHAPLLSKEA